MTTKAENAIRDMPSKSTISGWINCSIASLKIKMDPRIVRTIEEKATKISHVTKPNVKEKFAMYASIQTLSKQESKLKSNNHE